MLAATLILPSSPLKRVCARFAAVFVCSCCVNTVNPVIYAGTLFMRIMRVDRESHK